MIIIGLAVAVIIVGFVIWAADRLTDKMIERERRRMDR
jgi:hypothetical protein